ncbi:MAG: BLUF domain-containing protein [bacterium]|nr:BLUF domain-containing protein [bacterium]
MIYVSRRAEGVTDQVVVDDIVLPAGIKNNKLEITGCIWFSQDRFLQILEGPREAVEDVYTKILADDRHFDITTVSSSPISKRSFARWGMRSLKNSKEDRIEELIHEYAPNFAAARTPAESPESSSVLEQVRAYLVELATVEPATN